MINKQIVQTLLNQKITKLRLYSTLVTQSALYDVIILNLVGELKRTNEQHLIR